MPSVLDPKLSASARSDPLSYPGETLAISYLLLDSWVYDIDPQPGARPGEWPVRVDGGPLDAAFRAGDLNNALSCVAAAPIQSRHPVVAFGSNSAPAQLLDKFAGLEGSGRVIPVLRGSIQGFTLGHSAHVSPPGYVPFVLVDGGDGSVLPVSVLWLDSHQLAVMNQTEPNYRLVAVPADRYPLTLDSGHQESNYLAYKGKWGALTWGASMAPVSAGTQEMVFSRLLGAFWFRALVGSGDLRSLTLRLRDDRGLRAAVRRELAARRMVTGDGWEPSGS